MTPARHNAGPVPSAIRWTGSKRRHAPEIARLIPPHRTYMEPFLGGAAVLWFMAKPGAVASDAYSPLVDFWMLVKDHPETVIAEYRKEWIALQNDFPNHYYHVRRRFNDCPNATDLSFLMRTCVNGIVRFNSRGEFNNSLHLTRRGMHPDRLAAAIMSWNSVVRNVTFRCCDYRTTLEEAVAGDFAYLDPPYARTRQRYAFGADAASIMNELERLNSVGVKWAMSFDGSRGECDMTYPVPAELYERRIILAGPRSPVGDVLNSGRGARVHESLYLNY